MVVVFLANGFEEIEALATVDILRRAGLEVLTVGIGGKTIIGTHNIAVTADQAEEEPLLGEVQAIVLPGTTNLEASPVVQACIERAVADKALVCAICAAPSILGHKGLLQGRKATCFPGFEDELIGAVCTGEAVAVDGQFITAKGAGVSMEFALHIVAELISPQFARELGEKMQCR